LRILYRLLREWQFTHLAAERDTSLRLYRADNGDIARQFLKVEGA